MEQYGETAEQCGTMWSNSVKLYGGIVEQCEKVKKCGGIVCKSMEQYGGTGEQCGPRQCDGKVEQYGGTVKQCGTVVEQWNGMVETVWNSMVEQWNSVK